MLIKTRKENQISDYGELGLSSPPNRVLQIYVWPLFTWEAYDDANKQAHICDLRSSTEDSATFTTLRVSRLEAVVLRLAKAWA